jgi:hypothetical protein
MARHHGRHREALREEGTELRRSYLRTSWLPAGSITLAACLAANLPIAPAAAIGRPAQTAQTAQLAVDATAQRVESAVSGGRLSGFAGDVVNPSPSRPGLTIYWHGPVPTTISSLAATAGTARVAGVASGIAIRFRPAPYSLAQLIGLRAQINNSPGFAAAGISMILIYPQATGLVIGVSEGSARARRLWAITRSRIPVRYVTESVVPLSRYLDTPPFWGGDFLAAKTLRQGLYTYCSSGFGVHSANNRNNFFMLTAAHCMIRGDLRKQRFWIAGNGETVGTTWGFSAPNDTVSLATRTGVRGAGGGSSIYAGGTGLRNSGGEHAAAVLGASYVRAGDLIAQSGAFSGERTGIRVTTNQAEWVAVTVDGVTYRVFGAFAQKRKGVEAAGQGDSGGPMFVTVRNGVIAVGLVSSAPGNAHARCVGVVPPGRQCYSSVLFPIMTGTSTSILAQLRLRLNTR